MVQHAVVPQETVASPELQFLNPTLLNKPVFLLNVPFSLDTQSANNAWMEEVDPEERHVDRHKAINQFSQLYHFLAAEAIVYLLPTPRTTGLQDLVYCANLGIVLEHLHDKNTVLMSNFSSEVRIPETEVGIAFFESMGYDVSVPPYHFEGEAELKHLYDNVYIGGYGTRSDHRAYEWMAENYDMVVVPVEETDPYLYHVDCTVFPLTRDDTLVCTEMYTKEEVAEIEKHTNIIDVTVDDCLSGICNSVRVGNIILNSSNIHALKRTDEYYEAEKQKNRSLDDIAVRSGFEVNFFNLSEFMKSGALLSCMVMHLNRRSYDYVLVV